VPDAGERDAAAVNVVELDGVSRWFGRGGGRTAALCEVSAGFAAGSFTAVVGASGSGKSTLLHCAAGLDRPTSGRVLFEGRSIEGLSQARLTRLRQQRMGFVFQSYNLLPALSVADNVALPLRLRGQRPGRRQVEEVLDRVGLADRWRARPDQLSGGQQQRTAIARALVTEPAVIFADEPTGALDIVSSRGVLALLRACVDRDGRTVVMVSHDPVCAAAADRVVFVADGRIVGEVTRPTPDLVASRLITLLTAVAS
jgi:putative ABC transport system ATP-binding protein